eukprot:TRINITY_DN22628_c0_g6_i1.p1 TRINITY_DN22628_c0_g6~~TRINITY_DN22628_c0_g6_i1.p1  ORF type:complete len:658 (-),score=83.22 TRINITY_DN22628_c0_g6_i1:129-2066(-)
MNGAEKLDEKAVAPPPEQAFCAQSGSTCASHMESWFTEALYKERSAITAMLKCRHQALEQDFKTCLRTRIPTWFSSNAAAPSQALWPVSPTKPLEDDEDVSAPFFDDARDVTPVVSAHMDAEQDASAHVDAEQGVTQLVMHTANMSCKSVVAATASNAERIKRSSTRASCRSSFFQMAKTTSRGPSKVEKLTSIIYNHKYESVRAPYMPRSNRFIALLIEQFMGLITVVNIVTIGISTDHGEGWVGWVIIDAFFAICYTGEMAIKLRLLGCRLYFRGSEFVWNILEATLVFLALAELIITLTQLGVDDSDEETSGSKISLLRVIRLTRIVRLVRVCKLDAFGELAQIIHGAMGGMRTLAWSMVMVCLPLYTVALILRETVGTYDDADEHAGIKEFTHLGSGIFTVFRCVVAGDCTNENGMPIIVLLQQQYGWGYALLYVSTLLGFNFGLVNVILAIYVENSVAASKFNQIAKKRNRLLNNKLFSEKACELVYMIVYYAAQVLEAPACVEYIERSDGLEDIKIDEAEKLKELVTVACDLEITHDLFRYLSTDARFSELLSELDISTEDQLDLFDTFDVDGSQSLDLVELLQGVKKLRGDPHRSDVIGVSLLVRGLMDTVDITQQSVDSIYQRQEAMMRYLKRLAAP